MMIIRGGYDNCAEILLAFKNYQSVLANAYRIYSVYLLSPKCKFMGNTLEEPIDSDALLLTPVSKNRLYIAAFGYIKFWCSL
jgi:hypothetical protein